MIDIITCLIDVFPIFVLAHTIYRIDRLEERIRNLEHKEKVREYYQNK